MRIHNGIRRLIVNFASPRARASRIERFVEEIKPRPGMKVVDLGGTPSIWRFCHIPLDITIVNLDVDSFTSWTGGHHCITVIKGDATDLYMFPDGAFDIAFSNSAIEHVGGAENRLRFASELRRVAPRYFVQTPSIAFPYEVHTGIPFWWFLPSRLRRKLILRWRRTNPTLATFVAGTEIVRSRELKAIFADGKILTEHMLGLKKSNLVVRFK